MTDLSQKFQNVTEMRIAKDGLAVTLRFVTVGDSYANIFRKSKLSNNRTRTHTFICTVAAKTKLVDT